MNPKTTNFQFIECCGTLREMGRQYGEAARLAEGSDVSLQVLIREGLDKSDAADGQSPRRYS
jgi:hypothetical protein